MKHRIIKKSLIGILFLTFWMNATTAQSKSMPVEQNIDSTKIEPGAPIKYQHFGDGKQMRRITGGIRENCLLGTNKIPTILVPENNPVLTTVEQTKLFFIFPKLPKLLYKDLS